MKKALTIILLTFLLIGCKNEAHKIKIGAVVPLTGVLSEMGEAERNGMLLAIENLRKDGIDIDLIVEDSKSNTKEGVTSAMKLINIDQCNILLTSTTSISLAIEPVITEKKLNHIAYCMDADIASKSEYVTRIYEGIDEEVKAIKEYISKNDSVQKVALFYNSVEVWDKVNKNDLQPFIERLGKEVVFHEDFSVGEKDFKNLILKLKASELDHLILLGYGFEFPLIFKELKNQSLLDKITIIGGWGFLYSKVEDKYLEGVLVAGPEYVFRDGELAAEFKKHFIEKYNHTPNFDAAMAYNAIYLIGKNIVLEDLQNPIKSKLANKQYQGVVGEFTIDNVGNMILKTSLGVYKNGKIIFE